MPELPEVENVVQSIAADVKFPVIFKKIDFYRKNLRWTLPKKQLQALQGQTILKVERRAKYILFRLQNHTLISHLGMTGQWSIVKANSQALRKKHDHVKIEFADGLALIYNDPRRFGFLLVEENQKLDKYFSHLGVEPFQGLTEETLRKIKKADRSIKSVLMDQKIVVGIGNIYACEALFKVGINPRIKAKRLTIEKIKKLYAAADKILAAAIAAGGSTIANYLNAKSEAGQFQNSHLVYDRQGEPCVVCAAPIQRLVQSGRSTFWCKTCQK